MPTKAHEFDVNKNSFQIRADVERTMLDSPSSMPPSHIANFDGSKWFPVDDIDISAGYEIGTVRRWVDAAATMGTVRIRGMRQRHFGNKLHPAFSSQYLEKVGRS